MTPINGLNQLPQLGMTPINGVNNNKELLNLVKNGEIQLLQSLMIPGKMKIREDPILERATDFH